MAKKRHHWIVRVTHWVNVVAVVIMVGSGLQIFNAYPAFARKGELFAAIRGKASRSGLADVRRLARRRSQLALRDDVVLSGTGSSTRVRLSAREWRDLVRAKVTSATAGKW